MADMPMPITLHEYDMHCPLVGCQEVLNMNPVLWRDMRGRGMQAQNRKFGVIC